MIIILIVSILYASLLTGCDGINDASTGSAEDERPSGWTGETHGDNVEPDYETVFPENTVNRVKITVSPENWEKLQENMTELYGQEGTGNLPGRMLPEDEEAVPLPESPLPGDTRNPDGENILPRERFFPRDRQAQFPPLTGNMTSKFNITGNMTPRFNPDNAGTQPPVNQDELPEIAADRLPGWANMATENPEWVTATVEFDGLTWTNVGFRYKGNSSLTASWRRSVLKIPFKLDFDEFEDEYPGIDDQRFYGFKQLSFSNAFNDGTYMRDAIASDLLEDSGLASAKTAWYEVIVDYGEGEINLGLFVLTEVIDDTVIDRVFGDDSGNIYEGDGRGVSLAANTYNQIQSSFLKENNKDEADWSDIEELFEVLHSDTRTANPEEWRDELEDIFDTDSFLNWLSISAVLQHWDTYGSMTHNFYLYNNPETGQLTWISWDHNEILSGDRNDADRQGRPVAGIMAGRNLSLGRSEVTDQWPLIRFLLDDPVYYDRYLDYMDEFINGAFDPDKLEAWCEKNAELLTPWLDETESNDFTAAMQNLIDQITDRYLATAEFLGTEGY
ncbi:MAG: CotH kinase family protein [Dehalococcoidales bacterium]|nr:CotH kinase family protein [Dehalococcoidales bacterium]